MGFTPSGLYLKSRRSDQILIARPLLLAVDKQGQSMRTVMSKLSLVREGGTLVCCEVITGNSEREDRLDLRYLFGMMVYFSIRLLKRQLRKKAYNFDHSPSHTKNRKMGYVNSPAVREKAFFTHLEPEIHQ